MYTSDLFLLSLFFKLGSFNEGDRSSVRDNDYSGDPAAFQLQPKDCIRYGPFGCRFGDK